MNCCSRCLPNKERVILDLNGLDSHSLIVKRRDRETALLQFVDIFGVNLITMSVALLDNGGALVHGSELAPFGARLKVCCASTESHGAAHLPRKEDVSVHVFLKNGSRVAVHLTLWILRA